MAKLNSMDFVIREDRVTFKRDDSREGTAWQQLNANLAAIISDERADLLAACKAALFLVESQPPRQVMDTHQRMVSETLRAAIAKAEGTQA